MAKESPSFFFRREKPDVRIGEVEEGWERSVLGLDDTDSASMGMCTTYLAALLVERALEDIPGMRFTDYPHLVRLNPQVPNKTRGNGAVAISFTAPPGGSELVVELARDLVATRAALEDRSTHPGLALMAAPSPPPELRHFYRKCLHRIVSRREALRIAQATGTHTVTMKRGLGVIGALAALGADFSDDQTFEIIAYRGAGITRRERDLDRDLVVRMDREIPETFYNYDYVHHKICLAPASPCPVNFGIRGETPEAVLRAFEMLEGRNNPLAMIFRTNQHTDAHIEPVQAIASVLPLSSAMVRGRVVGRPRPMPGGHVVFTLADGSGCMDCIAYEPTKEFRSVVRELAPGDELKAYGSIRPAGEDHGPTLNLEKIEVLDVVSTRLGGPPCPHCGARMTSMGRRGGYKCRTKGCGYRDPRAHKVEIPIQRAIGKGFHEAPPVAWRHLYRPVSRMRD